MVAEVDEQGLGVAMTEFEIFVLIAIFVLSLPWAMLAVFVFFVLLNPNLR